ncbi:MAG: hypothetical protein Q7T38_09100 [Gallionella sp.]|nr:hypothetical protein [Gallionella sp.]
MCFSATASFVAGVSLTAIGVVTVKMAKRKTKIPFAMIPLLFGIQQLIEGMLWLSFKFEAPLLNVSMTYLFTFFSHVLWPIFMPLSIGLMETVPWRKKVILAFQIIGGAVGLYLLYFIIRFPITSEIKVHVMYIFPHFHKPMVLLLYIVATCVSGFFSSHKMVNIFGVLALLLFIVAYWFYTVAFFSVWCFFSAILSAIIYLHFKSGNQRAPDLMAQRT